jgi:hypothetical protein
MDDVNNMNDIEEQVRRYRPVGPPDALRARVIAANQRGKPNRLLEWLPAAVAAGVAVAFYMLGAGARADADAFFSEAQQQRAALVDQVAGSLGDDPLARQAAEEIVGAALNPPDVLDDPVVVTTNHD